MPVDGLASRALVFGLIMAVAGCAGVEERDSGPAAPVTKEPDYTPAAPPVTAPRPPARPPRPATNSAWQPLVDKAAGAAARGDYEQALALLERAQRIDPESGAIYLALARTHKARGNTAQARAMAERGMLFCSGQAECNALRAYTK